MQCTQGTHAQQQCLRRILWDLKANEKKKKNPLIYDRKGRIYIEALDNFEVFS
jgi:hypothetical protein